MHHVILKEISQNYFHIFTGYDADHMKLEHNGDETSCLHFILGYAQKDAISLVTMIPER